MTNKHQITIAQNLVRIGYEFHANDPLLKNISGLNMSNRTLIASLIIKPRLSTPLNDDWPVRVKFYFSQSSIFIKSLFYKNNLIVNKYTEKSSIN